MYVVFGESVKRAALSYWDGEKFCYAWVDCGEGIFANIERAIRDKHEPLDEFELSIKKWRGLAKNPRAKPKPCGNKRKVMYVVCCQRTRCTQAVFAKKENAQEYAEHLNFPVYITKIRFRTPEQD